VRVLLDTHAFVWFALNDSRLTSTARTCLADPATEVLLSPASYWEIAIKVSLGKYVLSDPFETFLNTQIQINNLTVLPISVAHAGRVASLPLHHRDPFDRLLVAQALVEQIPIVSTDSTLDLYGIGRIW
jgi:PIN domain nuclease of toxin-antitoxin system